MTPEMEAFVVAIAEREAKSPWNAKPNITARALLKALEGKGGDSPAVETDGLPVAGEASTAPPVGGVEEILERLHCRLGSDTGGPRMSKPMDLERALDVAILTLPEIRGADLIHAVKFREPDEAAATLRRWKPFILAAEKHYLGELNYAYVITAFDAAKETIP